MMECRIAVRKQAFDSSLLLNPSVSEFTLEWNEGLQGDVCVFSNPELS
jgi:hypothetical protein